MIRSKFQRVVKFLGSMIMASKEASQEVEKILKEIYISKIKISLEG